MSPETADYIDELKAVHGEVETLSKGSSLKLCMVAAGKRTATPFCANHGMGHGGWARGLPCGRLR